MNSLVQIHKNLPDLLVYKAQSDSCSIGHKMWWKFPVHPHGLLSLLEQSDDQTSDGVSAGIRSDCEMEWLDGVRYIICDGLNYHIESGFIFYRSS